MDCPFRLRSAKSMVVVVSLLHKIKIPLQAECRKARGSRSWQGGSASSGAPTHGIIHIERAPEGHRRLRAHACLLHDRPNVRLGLLKEGLKALGVGPLVHGHVLAIPAVPARRDEPVALGGVHDATDRLAVCSGGLLERSRIATDPQ